MPLTNDDISWGDSLVGEVSHTSTGNGPAVQSHYIWQTVANGATVIAVGDNNIPYLATTNYGNGTIIYDAAMQPVEGNGGWAPGMYAYSIFRNAIQWAFQTANLPIIKVSPWPYPYNAAYEVRHDFEDYQADIAAIASSAQAESLVGAKGDYYFCTGTLRVEMANSPSVIAGLQQAVTSYGATIGSHNGGLQNPNNPGLVLSDYDYWHWGPDEALDDQPTGYASGSAYASASISQSFADVDSWLTGYETNRRNWVAPYFNGTREGSFQVLQQLGAVTAGEQKVGPFPHWTVSNQTEGMLYSFVTLPVSDWFIDGNIAQSQETDIPPPWTTATIEAAVDYYYNFGALVNFYSHEPSTNSNIAEYVHYAASKPSIWPVNATTVYHWWTNRTPVQVTPGYTIAGNRLIATAAISGATDPNTAIELIIPNWSLASTGIQVLLDGAFAPPSSYRIYNQGIKVLVGTSVSSVQVSYPLTSGPIANNDTYSIVTGNTLNVSAPGVLGNDSNSGSGSLTAILATQPSQGALTFNANGSFTYTPVSGFVGTDSFTYVATNGVEESGVATVFINVNSAGNPEVFEDNFSGQPGSDPLWTTVSGTWSVANGMMSGSSPEGNYGFAHENQSWTNYSVQGQIQFSSGAYGGGIGGRVNTSTGAHYGVWVYPEGTLGTSAVLQVIKFESWGTWNGTTPMARATLPGVGTAWHTLLATFNGSNIQVSFDGVQYINVTDNGFDAQPVYTSGNVSLDMWTNSAPGSSYLMSVEKISMQALSSAPEAQNDSYNMSQGGTLSIASPGVLGNDTNLLSSSMTAILMSPPANGTLNLQSNGSFTYAPLASFTGVDTFTYQASAGGLLSNVATVTITVIPTGTQVLFGDSFSGESGADPLWTTVEGTWYVANGTMNGLSPAGTYGEAYANGNWADYSVQAQIQFTGGSWGGGIGGLVNASTGAHYGVWVYPEGSLGASAVLRVIKFEGWGTWNGTTPMAQATLPSVGTAWHTLLATFQGGSIQVSFDGVQYISVTDNGFDSQPIYTSGGISLDLWTNTSIVMSVENILVFSAAPVAQNQAYTVSQGGTLSIAAPGVLTNDTGNTGLTATLVSSPANGTLSLQSNGSFSYTPNASFSGVDSFTYQASAGSLLSNTATVMITVIPTGSQVLFSDNFSGQPGADPLWTTVTGTWSVANGTMIGSSPLQNYGFAYANGSWTDYSVQGQIKFPAGAYGGGIGGLVNASTGAHYGVWVYPEVSAGGSATLKIIKFEGWGTWNGTTPMAQATLPSMGTAWHTLLATFQGSSIQVSLDGVQYINVTDNGFDSTAAFTSGSISLDMYTYTTTYPLDVANILVWGSSSSAPTVTLSSVSLSPASVTGGTSSTGTVTLSSTAPTGGTTVTLTSSNTAAGTVPASVTVAAGATTATFTASTSAVATNTAVTITATLNGTNTTASLTVNAPAISSVALSPTSLTGGTSSTGTVTLSSAAATGGTTATLTSSNTAAATVPASVTVAAGATTATFTASTSAVATNTAVTITATLNGTNTTASLTVNAPAISSVALSPTSLTGGTSSTGTVTLSSAAATGGTTATLTSSNTAAATVPASVTVAAGATTATFTASTSAVATNTAVTITATLNGTTKTASLTVNAPAISSVKLSPTSVAGGTSSAGTVTLTGAAPTSGTTVTLTSNSAAATVPASVTVAAGATTATFTASTSAVATNTAVTISATLNGTTKTATLTVDQPAISSVKLSPTSVAGGTSSTGTVTLGSAAPTGGTTVTLTSNSAAATVPASVTVAAGATTATFTASTSAVATNTAVTISATLNGTTKTATLTVDRPAISSLTLSPTSVAGGTSSTGTVTLGSAAPTGGTTVTLTSNNTAAATVPASVTVAAGATTATFTVTTKTVTASKSVSISGTLNGTTKSATLTVTVP
jgi:hypothetical protein